MAEREQEPRRWTLTRYRNGELNGSCYGDIEDTEIVERIEVVEISSEAGPPRLEREEAELMLRLLDLVDGTHGLNTDELEFQAKLRALADTETGAGDDQGDGAPTGAAGAVDTEAPGPGAKAPEGRERWTCPVHGPVPRHEVAYDAQPTYPAYHRTCGAFLEPSAGD
jgi:hypothetical protein